MSSSNDSTKPNSNQPTSVDENASMQRILITLGLAILGEISNEFTYWTNLRHAIGIWICGCILFFKRELWASKSAGALSTESIKISGCKRWYPKDLRVSAPPLSHSLYSTTFLGKFHQSSLLSIEVIRARLGEIAGGVSARETLEDVFETICRIFQEALRITIKLLRGPA